MIYNNLIYFLVAILSFSMAGVPVQSDLSPYFVVVTLFILVVAFDKLVAFFFSRVDLCQTASYFRAEKHASVLALLVYGFLIFGLDLKYYLAPLSINDTFPALVNISGMVVFLLFFTMIWRRARTCYEHVFARKYNAVTFIYSNVKANLPLVIPWVILTFCYDLINLIPSPMLQELNQSSWGDVFFFGTFMILVFVFFPPLVRKLWGCKKLEQGPLRNHLHEFCTKHGFSAEICIWPLFEGRMVTAGVMGVVPGLRYILLTPALLETMTIDELDSVMAHEIGHVKRFHLILYVFLIGGFMLATACLAEPLYYSFFSADIFYAFVRSAGLSPEMMRNIVVFIPSLLFLLFYFRFLFGYFMRNFERQADLHVFSVLGNSAAIISAFEKIATLSGNIRNQPCWHHFGIGQRVDFLRKCENNPAEIDKHHRKVNLSLVSFVAALAIALLVARSISSQEAVELYVDKYTKAVLLYTASQEDNPAHWLFFAGNYLLQHKLDKRAAIAFELAIEKEPGQPELLNNYSWLLLTSGERKIRNPEKALQLARKAALLRPTGFIFDTLATALWANGFLEKAVETAQQAMRIDPAKTPYYQRQINRFQTSTYLEEQQNITTKGEKTEIFNISEGQG